MEVQESIGDQKQRSLKENISDPVSFVIFTN